MNAFNRLVVLGALAMLVGISGCVVREGGPGHGPYTYENGDRIDHDGHRDAHWCDNHHDDEGCHR
jgi:hypothetical protein